MTKQKYPASDTRIKVRKVGFAIPSVTHGTKQFAHALSRTIKSEGRKGRLVEGKRPDWPSKLEE